MLKINLLPAEQRKTEIPIWRLYRFLAYVFLGIALLIWAFYLGIYAYNQKQITSVNNEIEQNKVWRERYDKAEIQNTEIVKVQAISNNLNRDKIFWSDLLVQLGNITPNGCWLQDVKQNTTNVGSTLQLTGGCLDMESLLSYVDKLQTLPNIASVQILDTNEAMKNNVRVVNFNIMIQRTKEAAK